MMGVRLNSLHLTRSSADSDLSVLKLAADWNHLGILTTDARAPPPTMLDLIVLGCGLSNQELWTSAVNFEFHWPSIQTVILSITHFWPHLTYPTSSFHKEIWKKKNQPASLAIILWRDGMQSACQGLETDGPDYCSGLQHLPAVWLSAGYLTSLWFSFLIWKVFIKIPVTFLPCASHS